MGQGWRQSCKKESSKILGGVAERYETKRDYAEAKAAQADFWHQNRNVVLSSLDEIL